jgi:hypothetical protein
MPSTKRHIGLRMVAAVLAAMFTLLPFALHAEDERQYKIEAAFLYNFFNYITWPDYTSPQALKQPVICLYNDDPVLTYLTYVQQKMAAERPLTIRTVQDGESLEGCHMLFSRNNRDDTLPQNGLPASLLTVSDRQGSIKNGEMIEVSQEDERMVMKINQSLLAQKGFQVSSRLLSLAEKVN